MSYDIKAMADDITRLGKVAPIIVGYTRVKQGKHFMKHGKLHGTKKVYTLRKGKVITSYS